MDDGRGRIKMSNTGAITQQRLVHDIAGEDEAAKRV